MLKRKKYKRLVVGGCFLILHPGHVDMLRQAKSISKEVWVVVASDATLNKKYGFSIPQEDRARLLEGVRYVDKVIKGKDRKEYRVLEEVDAVGLGYDQGEKEIKEILKTLPTKVDIVKLKAYKPEIYSTSKLLGINKIRG